VHHVVLERWSRGNSFVHRRDPRAKIVALVAFLVVVATAHGELVLLAAALFVFLSMLAICARLPLVPVMARAALVLPFTLVFAAIAWRPALIPKTYLSAMAVLIVVSTTPLPLLIRGMESLGAPRFLLMVAQFLYRYLFVISEEGQHILRAAASRGGSFRAAAGALAVLFARSYGRAEEIHRAMLARGFPGHFRTLNSLRFQAADAAFALIVSAVPVLLRVAVG
jgi:cobalt/nickel transport system permease protein